MSEAAKWYVIHTYSGYENKVAQTILKVVENRKLHDLIPEVRVPTEMVMEKNDKDEMREVERKIFPGYVLVKEIHEALRALSAPEASLFLSARKRLRLSA